MSVAQIFEDAAQQEFYNNTLEAISNDLHSINKSLETISGILIRTSNDIPFEILINEFLKTFQSIANDTNNISQNLK